MFEEFDLAPRRRDFQGVSAGVTKDEKAAGSEDFGQSRRIEKLLGKRKGSPRDVFIAKRGIGHNQVKDNPGGGKLGEAGKNVLHADFN